MIGLGIGELRAPFFQAGERGIRERHLAPFACRRLALAYDDFSLNKIDIGPAEGSEKLEQQRLAIAAELNETAAVDLMGLDLAKLTAEITRLRFSENSLLVALEDPQPGFLSPISENPRGGVSAVRWS